MHRGWHSRGYLPHFDEPNLIQSITFRLHDSLPDDVLQGLRADSKWRDDPKRRQQVETLLDSGAGACYLSRPEIAALVQNALFYFDGKRYRLLAWVIMPNHVHVLVQMVEGFALDKVVQSWKSFTAQEANLVLGREGRFWYPDYYDRYIRNQRHFNAVIRYIHANPVKAKLVANAADWRFGSAQMWEVGHG